MSESRERSDFSGNYTEHYDDEGNKIGESRERNGSAGKYFEHYDAAGNKIGESQDCNSLLESTPVTEHFDVDGRKTGESIKRETLFGDYTEHQDSTGRTIGESHKRQGAFEDYAEHKGTGWRGRETRPQPSPSPSGGGGCAPLGCGCLVAILAALFAFAFAITAYQVFWSKLNRIWPAPFGSHRDLMASQFLPACPSAKNVRLKSGKQVDLQLEEHCWSGYVIFPAGQIMVYFWKDSALLWKMPQNLLPVLEPIGGHFEPMFQDFWKTSENLARFRGPGHLSFRIGKPVRVPLARKTK